MPTVSAHSQALATRCSDSQSAQAVLACENVDLAPSPPPPQGINIDDAIVDSLEDQRHPEEKNRASPSMAGPIPNTVRRAMILPLTPGLSQILPYISLSILLLPFIYIFNHLMAQLRKFRVRRPRPVALDGIELLPTIMPQRNGQISTTAEHLSRSSTPFGVWTEQSNVGSGSNFNGTNKSLPYFDLQKLPRSSSVEAIPRPATSPTTRRPRPDTESSFPLATSGSITPTPTHTFRSSSLPASPSAHHRTQSLSGVSAPASGYSQLPRYPTRATLPNPHNRNTISSPSTPQPFLIDFTSRPLEDFASPASSISAMSSLSSTSDYSCSKTSRRGSTISDLGDPRALGLELDTDFLVDKNGKGGVEWTIATPPEDEDDIPLANLTMRRKQGFPTQHGFIIPPFAPRFDPFGDDAFGMRREVMPLLSAENPSRVSLSSSSSIETDQDSTSTDAEPTGSNPLPTPPVTATFVPTSSMYAGGIKVAEQDDRVPQDYSPFSESEDRPLIDLEAGIYSSAGEAPTAHVWSFEEPVIPSEDLAEEVSSDLAGLNLPLSSSYLSVPAPIPDSPSFSPPSPFAGLLEVVAPTPIAFSPTLPDVDDQPDDSPDSILGGVSEDKSANGVLEHETVSRDTASDADGALVNTFAPPKTIETNHEARILLIASKPPSLPTTLPVRLLSPQSVLVEALEFQKIETGPIFTDSEALVCASPLEMSPMGGSVPMPPSVLAEPVETSSVFPLSKLDSLPPLSIPSQPLDGFVGDIVSTRMDLVVEDTKDLSESMTYPDPDLMPLPQMAMISPIASSSPISPISLCAKLPSPKLLLHTLPPSPLMDNSRSESTQTNTSNLFSSSAIQRSNSSGSSSSVSTIICPPSARPVGAEPRPTLESEEQASSRELSPVLHTEKALEQDEQSEPTSEPSEEASVSSPPSDSPSPTIPTQPAGSTTNHRHFNPHSLRVHRSPLDFALAMQQPGLINADMTWMVNFFILVFGWVTILGGRRKPQQVVEGGAVHHRDVSPSTSALGSTSITHLANQPTHITI
ncbi:hypothetical protein BDN72DRAFT_895856 [Pluteus cervinus]|uniref:Uncharacterized protein n=1 Tax=Pluteus cervinus TaxID=181527 RepID=A0ACD3AZ89_9AGAR|nr:hypothetical protein BDN72DRAFT_895856 [Pluteus cervinus]